MCVLVLSPLKTCMDMGLGRVVDVNTQYKGHQPDCFRVKEILAVGVERLPEEVKALRS